MLELTSSPGRSENKRCSWSLDRPGRTGDYQCSTIAKLGNGTGVPLCPSHWGDFTESIFAEDRIEDRGGAYAISTLSGEKSRSFVKQRDEARREVRDLTYKLSRLQGERGKESVASEATIKALRAENNRLVGELKVVRDGLASNSKVYLIKCGDQVKIGRSGNPEKRLSEIKRGNACLMDGGLDPAASELLYEMPGHVAEETELHRRFRAYRTTGEWFRIEGELSDYIRGLGVMVTQG